MPALEAMAAGLPVVASNTSSIPEVVGDAGLLFNPLSIDDGARAVVEVLESRDSQEALSRAGVARARAFTWERTGRATLEGYKRAHEILRSKDEAVASRMARDELEKVESSGTFV